MLFNRINFHKVLILVNMAVKTKAAILAVIAALLADNTAGDISASDMRTCLNDITDSYFDASYKLLTWNMIQVGTSAPEFRDASGANNPLINTFGEVPVLSRLSAGIYKLTVVAALFDKYKLNLPYSVTLGATGALAMTIIDAGGVGGYIYIARESDYIIRITCVTDAFVVADISSILSNDVISMPDIKSFV